ncbi:MAG: cobalt-precorrin 5A hydrolase [Clostridia bacterium]|nr:cobalt-precorrin 5A hydrolase [Clostridia bacterium]
MTTAVIALTGQGLLTAKRVMEWLTLQGKGSVHIYLPEKLSGLAEVGPEEEIIFYQGPLGEELAKIFQQYRVLICIMALGIVVRIIGPLAVNKGEDPAVVVMDEKSQFAISVLSGHLGGANELTGQLAEALGATAVVTTATDVQGKRAIDALARQWDMAIEPLAVIKAVNGALLENKEIPVYYEGELPEALPEPYRARPFNTGEDQAELTPMVYITNKVILSSGEGNLFLRPKNLVVGVGCRRGCPVTRVKGAIQEVLTGAGLSLKSIRALATVEIKRDEEAITEAARQLGVEVKYFSTEAINDFWVQAEEANIPLIYSDFVKQQIGVSGVCEPTALMAWPGARLIVPKTNYQGVTVAVAEVS